LVSLGRLGTVLPHIVGAVELLVQSLNFGAQFDILHAKLLYFTFVLCINIISLLNEVFLSQPECICVLLIYKIDSLIESIFFCFYLVIELITHLKQLIFLFLANTFQSCLVVFNFENCFMKLQDLRVFRCQLMQ
jgi:hypothetical protein